MPDLHDLLTALDDGQTIPGGSPLHEVMHRVSQDALRITGTPTFVIGGRMVRGYVQLDQMQQIVAQERDAAAG